MSDITEVVEAQVARAVWGRREAVEVMGRPAPLAGLVVVLAAIAVLAELVLVLTTMPVAVVQEVAQEVAQAPAHQPARKLMAPEEAVAPVCSGRGLMALAVPLWGREAAAVRAGILGKPRPEGSPLMPT